MNDYATKYDPHAMRFAERLVQGMDHDTKRAMLTHLIAEGAMPVLAPDAGLTATQDAACRAVWDALVRLRPGYLPPAADAIKAPQGAAMA